MKQSIKIETIIKSKSSLKIEWNDGKKSNYAYLWLRDNCPSDIDPNARERTFNILDVSEKIKPKSYKINNKKQLEVKWNEGNHIRYYDQSWLRKNCYSINNNKSFSMTDGSEVRDFISINDAVKMIVRSIKFFNSKNKTFFKVAHIANGKPVKVIDFVKKILLKRNSNIKLNIGNRET